MFRVLYSACWSYVQEDGEKHKKHDTIVAGYSSYCCCLLDTSCSTRLCTAKEYKIKIVCLHREADISAYWNLYAASFDYQICLQVITNKRHKVKKAWRNQNKVCVFMTHAKRENKYHTRYSFKLLLICRALITRQLSILLRWNSLPAQTNTVVSQ